ncbi:MAG: ABC transporter permease [Anaerolineae bacterium]|nr:ABC transporter permease [Anaerolineae bacterium]
MLAFLARRLGGAVLVLAVVSLVSFALLDWVPGDAAQSLIGEYASAEALEQLRQEMGLDAPLPVRYGRYVWGALRGDLGRSLISGRPVAELVATRLGHTALLAVTALAVALVLGGALGMLAAARSGGLLDLALMAVSCLGVALPTYWLGLMLILLFALRLGWLPVAGAGTPAHLVLPALSLALPTAAMVARLVRASVLDVRDAEYVRTAWAKGLPAWRVWQRHILRNSVIPVVTMVALHLGHLLGGAVVVESIFGWPGVGRLVVQAVLDQDYPVVLGGVLLMAAMYQALNLLVDLAHGWLDPRVGTGAL